MRKFILLFTVTLLLFSCNKDKIYLSEEYSNLKEENVTFRVSPQEAVESLKLFIGADQSRSAKDVSIHSIKAITTELKSRSANNSDTLMYVINLSDEQGFAIMSADKRMEPIFALVDEGNYNPENSSNNPGFNMFMDMAKSYVINTTAKESNVETYYNPESDGWILRESKGPKVTCKWGQGYPYNIYTPVVNGKQTPVGCVAVALGMSCEYFLKSNTFNINEYTIDFSKPHDTTTDLISDFSSAQNIARFLREIGHNVNMNYQPAGSGASKEDSERFLKNESKIKYVTGFLNYGDSKTIRYLYDTLRLTSGGGIVVMGGDNGRVGHMWIIDGIKTYLGGENNKDKYLDLYHCNWGWEGDKDGWYLQSVYTYNNKIINGGPTVDAPASYPYNMTFCCLTEKKLY
jgi:hypothetical protein